MPLPHSANRIYPPIDSNQSGTLSSLLPVELKQGLPKKSNFLLVQGAMCLWAVAVFIWYFYQFSPIISPLLKSILQKLWH